jgi:tetratricopeptide (TPR) repeat protein
MIYFSNQDKIAIAMFSKLFGRSKKEDIDLSLGYARLAEFKNYLTSGNYSKFEKEYEQLTWDAKTLLNEGIGLNKDHEADVQRWVQQCPDSYIANLFAGVSKTCLAWIARTAASGASVSEKNANRFLVLLEEAAAFLSRADEINPDDAETCARTIRVYMGLGVEEESVLSYFNAAANLQPNHLMAHLMMINYLNPKWMGSLEAMHDFAGQRMEVAGSSLLITLKLFALTEEWLYYSMNGDAQKHAAFFDNEAIKTAVNSWYDNYKEEQDGALLIPYVYNYFAFLFWKTGDKQKARELIKKIPGKMTVYPWTYIDVETNEQLQKL